MAETHLEPTAAETSGDGWKQSTFVSTERDRTIQHLVGAAADIRQKNRTSAGRLFTSFADDAPSVANDAATPHDVLTALNYGLEFLRCGAILVTIEGRAHLSNRAANAILEKKDGLALSKNTLIADRASDTRLLQQLVQEAITAPEQGEPQGSPIPLPRRAARAPLVVRVAPGPGLSCWPSMQNRTALVTLYDEDTDLQVDESLLRKLYGLTRGEAALSAILLQGRKSIEEAAAELFISPHTARTHLKRIFLKTDTHRQSELVARMFSALL